MNCLLLGGAPSVGKSESVYRLAKYLLSKGFSDITNSVPEKFEDFRAILEGLNKNGEKTRIIINTPTDTVKIINELFEFYHEHGTYDILISSVRDHNFWPRNDFFKIMNIDEESTIEIPLAKITRKKKNFNSALSWYQKKVDKLVVGLLNNEPFNI